MLGGDGFYQAFLKGDNKMFGSYNDAERIIHNYIAAHQNPLVTRELYNVLNLIHDAQEKERRVYENENFDANCQQMAFDDTDICY